MTPTGNTMDCMSEAAGVEPRTQHLTWERVPVERVNPLFERQLIVGEYIMVARLVLKKECLIPMHSHINEQVSNVLSGALEFTIDGKEILLRAGEYLCIPPNVPHTAVAVEDTVAVDIFSPPREDWLNKTDQYLRT